MPKTGVGNGPKAGVGTGRRQVQERGWRTDSAGLAREA